MKKNKWRKRFLSLLPLVIVLIMMICVIDIFKEDKQNVEHVSKDVAIQCEEEEVSLNFTKFQIAKDEIFHPIKEFLEESLKSKVEESVENYSLGVKPNATFQLLSYSEVEDPYSMEITIDHKKVKLDKNNKGVFPNKEGIFPIQVKKKYSNKVILFFEGEVCISKNEETRNEVNVARMISPIRDVDRYSYATQEGYEIAYTLFGRAEARILQAKEKMLSSCIVNLSDGKEELLSDYVLCRWIAQISGIGMDYDSWKYPSDYRKKYLKEVMEKYEISVDYLQ